jgi:hypothetical protein
VTASYVNPVDGTAWLTRQDLLTVLGALADAVTYRSVFATPDDVAMVVRYRAIQRGLGDDR